MDEGKLETRCPRLGGQVYFRYCRTCGEDGMTCHKILDCWWERFDIFSYLKKRLSETEFQKLMATRPKPKMTSLVEIMEQALGNMSRSRVDKARNPPRNVSSQ